MPKWLVAVTAAIADARGWSVDWLIEAVEFHLSALATREGDHREFGTFPRSDSDAGLVVYVASLQYMLALKLKAVRLLDPLKGGQEAQDIRNLMKAAGIETAEAAVAVLAKFFRAPPPTRPSNSSCSSTCSPIWRRSMRPNTLSETYQRIIAGAPREKAFAEFLDTFYMLPDVGPAEFRSRNIFTESRPFRRASQRAE